MPPPIPTLVPILVPTAAPTPTLFVLIVALLSPIYFAGREADPLLTSSDNDSFVSAVKYIKYRPSRPTGLRFNFRRPT